MNTPNLYCQRSGDQASLFIIYSEYTSQEGYPHVLAYVGGQMTSGKWRSEKFLLERTPDKTIALVTDYGDWDVGSSYVRLANQNDYLPAATALLGQIDWGIEEQIYGTVNEWVYWDEGILRLRLDTVEHYFINDIAQQGNIDHAIVTELSSIWEASAPN